MKILVCFKIVNDLETVMKKDWDGVSQGGGIDISYTQKIINSYDESALECALRLRDAALAAGQETAITGVTVGSGNFDTFFKNLFAVGVECIIQMETNSDLRFAPYDTALRLATVAEQEQYDVILMGRQNAIGDNGQTPYALAQVLGMPCINHVIELRQRQDGLYARFEQGSGVRTGRIQVPAVYAMGNSTCPYLRVATLREKLGAARRAAEKYSDIPLSNRRGLPLDFVPVRLFRDKRDKKCVLLEGADPREKAETLYRQYLRERL